MIEPEILEATSAQRVLIQPGPPTSGFRGMEVNAMTFRVRTVTALNLRLGDVVIPDHGPRRRVTLRRLEGSHPVVVVQFEGIPGATIRYPPSMPLLIEEPD